MSTLCFLKKALRTLFIGILFWNSVVPSLEGMVRSAATFHVSIRRVLDDSMDGGDGNDFFRRGGEMGTFISDMSRTLAKRADPLRIVIDRHGYYIYWLAVLHERNHLYSASSSSGHDHVDCQRFEFTMAVNLTLYSVNGICPSFSNNSHSNTRFRRQQNPGKVLPTTTPRGPPPTAKLHHNPPTKSLPNSQGPKALRKRPLRKDQKTILRRHPL
jgi:hypothetical protein